MKTSNRRNFLKKVAVTAASAVAVPGLVKAASEFGGTARTMPWPHPLRGMAG